MLEDREGDGVIPFLKTGDVKFIAVHCSATGPQVDVGVQDIDRWHRAKGFLKIGYHYVIRRDGRIETGRPLTERGAHVEDWNHCSIGICLVGGTDGTKLNKPQANFAQVQLDSLSALLKALAVDYPKAVVQGHRDFPNVAKACPSFDVKTWLDTGKVKP